MFVEPIYSLRDSLFVKVLDVETMCDYPDRHWQTSHPCEHQKLELHTESEGIKKAYRCVACGTIMNQMRKRI